MSWSYVTCHVIDLTWLGQFQSITDPVYLEIDLVISHLTYLINLSTFGLTFWINFLNQPFKSTYAINLLIKLVVPLGCGTLLPLTNVCTWESAPTYWSMYDSGSWLSCKLPTCRDVKRITLKYLLVAVWIKALLDTIRTSLLCKH